MKGILFIITIFLLAIGGRLSVDLWFSRDYVEQEVRKHNDGTLCKSGTCFTTFVWHDNEIIKAWYDDIPTISDSLVAARKKQGEKILNALP